MSSNPKDQPSEQPNQHHRSLIGVEKKALEDEMKIHKEEERS